MKNLLPLGMIFIIALSSCAGKKVTVQGASIDAVNELIDYREFTFDDKKKSVSSKVISTEPPSMKLNGWTCVSPKVWNEAMAEWKKVQCKY